MNDELSKAGRQANADYYAAIVRDLRDKLEDAKSLFLDEVMILTTPKEKQ